MNRMDEHRHCAHALYIRSVRLEPNGPERLDGGVHAGSASARSLAGLRLVRRLCGALCSVCTWLCGYVRLPAEGFSKLGFVRENCTYASVLLDLVIYTAFDVALAFLLCTHQLCVMRARRMDDGDEAPGGLHGGRMISDAGPPAGEASRAACAARRVPLAVLAWR